MTLDITNDNKINMKHFQQQMKLIYLLI